MSAQAKIWIFRVLAAVTGVLVGAVLGIKADAAHWGMYFPIVAAAQALIVAGLGNFIKKYGT